MFGGTADDLKNSEIGPNESDSNDGLVTDSDIDQSVTSSQQRNNFPLGRNFDYSAFIKGQDKEEKKEKEEEAPKQ